MTDTILTHDMIAQRALFDLKNELTFAKNVYKGYTSEFHSVGGYKKGDSVRIHLPNKYRVQDGAGITLVDTYETNTTVTVDKHKHVALDFTSKQLTLDIENFSRKYIRPAVIALANYVDYDGCAEILNLYNEVGTPGTAPSTFQVLADAAERMDNEAVPRTDRVAVTSPKAHWALAAGELKGVFVQNMVETLIRKGFIGNFALMDFFMDQNIRTHTSGTGQDKMDGATIQIQAIPSELSATIALKGFAVGETLTAGTVFDVGTVIGNNPVSGEAWEDDQLRQFVVTTTTAADASGFMLTLPISPKIVSSAADAIYLPYQTVVDLPAVNDYITGTHSVASQGYKQNACFHPDCFALTMVPFEAPDSAGQSVKWSTATDDDLGLAITFASGYDISNYKEIYRLDILYGWDTIRGELGVRITG